jgi:hypothetical protein
MFLGGALEIAGTGHAFNLRSGDICIMDSSSLYHGSRDYKGVEDPSTPNSSDRVVGIFILWKSYLKLKGVPEEDLKLEFHETRTLPLPEIYLPQLKKRRKNEKRNERRKEKRKEKKKEKKEREREEHPQIIPQ